MKKTNFKAIERRFKSAQKVLKQFDDNPPTREEAKEQIENFHKLNNI